MSKQLLTEADPNTKPTDVNKDVLNEDDESEVEGKQIVLDLEDTTVVTEKLG